MTKRNSGSSRLSLLTSLVVFFLVLTLFGYSLTGCRAKETVFQDGAGRTVTLKKIPQRIISLSPAYTETIFALGLGDKLFGVSNYCNRPKEAQAIPKVGDAFNVNLEKIVSLKPDIAFCIGTPETKYIKDIENLGIPTYVSNPSTVKEVLEDIKRVAKALGVEKKGEEVVLGMQKAIDDASAWSKNVAKKPKTLILVDKDLWTVGPGSFMDDMLKVSGGENIVSAQNQPYLQISMEEVLAKDPDVILCTLPPAEEKALEERPGWASLRAVKNSRVFFVNPDLVSRPGPSIAEGIKEMANALEKGAKP